LAVSVAADDQAGSQEVLKNFGRFLEQGFSSFTLDGFPDTQLTTTADKK